MSNNNDFLKSAIADAKLIKEAAVQNAKKAIEESFAPHIKSMLSTKIQEMEDEELNEGVSDIKTFIQDLGTPEEVNAYIKMVEDQISSSDDNRYDGWEAKDFEEDFKYWVQDKMDSALEEEIVQEDEVFEEDFNLDELLNELSEEESLNESENIEEAKDDEAEDKDEETEDESDEEKEEDEDPEIDLENLSEEDLKTFIEEVIADMVEDGELETGEGSEEEGEMDLDFDLDGEEEEAADDSAELAEVEKQLQEALSNVESLKAQLNEMNLLNSKLLYTNKIYKSKNLTEDKKVRVLEAFDKAQTVKEVKLTYNLLNENISNTVKSSSTVKGFASKPSLIKENKTNNQVLEDDVMFKRMQRLAGL